MRFTVQLTPLCEQVLESWPPVARAAFESVRALIARDPWGGDPYKRRESTRVLSFGENHQGMVLWVVVGHAAEAHVVQLTWFG